MAKTLVAQYRPNLGPSEFSLSNLTLYLPCIFKWDMFNKHQLMHINFFHNSLFLKYNVKFTNYVIILATF
jgi:hypothetical protein